jgi:xanthine dehydrogenase YagT iron-sulfur-binding subunit
MDVTITTMVNGVTKRITTTPERSILEALREDMQQTGSKHRCGQGRCVGCVILFENRRVLSCESPIIEADQRSIGTIED